MKYKTSPLLCFLLTFALVLPRSVSGFVLEEHRHHRGGEMRAAHGRRGWPELVGKTYAEAEAAIKEVAPDIKKVVRVPMGSMVTQDYREDRVRVWVNREDKVEKPPKPG